MLPETASRTLEELDVLFENRVSVWRFGSYKILSGPESIPASEGVEVLEEYQEGKEKK